MADSLPLLKCDGQWLRPLRDSYRLGAPYSSLASNIGNGFAFVRAGHERQTRALGFSVDIASEDMAFWWWNWFAQDLKYGTRRFGALLYIRGAERYCVCALTSDARTGSHDGFAFQLSLQVEVVAEFDTEEELTGG